MTKKTNTKPESSAAKPLRKRDLKPQATCPNNDNITAQEQAYLRNSKALIEAARLGDCNHITKLLTQGADIEYNVNGYTPLACAIKASQAEAARLLVSKGAKLEPDLTSDNKIKWYPIHIAVAYNLPNMVRLLIELGADVNAPFSHILKSTPVKIAASNGYAEVLQILIDAGGAIPKSDNLGLCLYMVTILNGHDECSKIISKAQDLVNENKLTSITEEPTNQTTEAIPNCLKRIKAESYLEEDFFDPVDIERAKKAKKQMILKHAQEWLNWEDAISEDEQPQSPTKSLTPSFALMKINECENKAEPNAAVDSQTSDTETPILTKDCRLRFAPSQSE